MPSPIDLRIAARIHDARVYLELSVDEFAAMLNSQVEEVQAIEAGQVAVTGGMLTQIARCLGRSLEFFTADVPPGAADDRTAFLARAAETLSDRDMGELQRFATYLRTRAEGAAA
ncbi:helix-turn-helix transcriptional regulator [Sphingomonas panaciterrae]|jgi:transcriptional regulator with XRE-family HTH domain|uniref:helix-turn-helix domain-containing protein n=1 Tax=Sphingomonas panaciterrae TaxID=1462999 RepID=UPI002FF03447